MLAVLLYHQSEWRGVLLYVCPRPLMRAQLFYPRCMRVGHLSVGSRMQRGHLRPTQGREFLQFGRNTPVAMTISSLFNADWRYLFVRDARQFLLVTHFHSLQVLITATREMPTALQRLSPSRTRASHPREAQSVGRPHARSRVSDTLDVIPL